MDAHIAAAVVSLLSPRNKWDRNKQDAETLVRTALGGGSMDDFSVCTFTSNKRRAWDLVLSGGKDFQPEKFFKGLKTRSFHDNISHTASRKVTIDTWAVRAARDVEDRWNGSLTPKQYHILEAEYQEVADHVGLRPMDLQAVVWVEIRNTINNKAKLEVVS